MTRSGCRDPNQPGSGAMGEVARSARQQQCNFILSALASPTVTTITKGLVRAKH
jgi:hypothetical protein